jgi:hypothetical protein
MDRVDLPSLSWTLHGSLCIESQLAVLYSLFDVLTKMYNKGWPARPTLPAAGLWPPGAGTKFLITKFLSDKVPNALNS